MKLDITQRGKYLKLRVLMKKKGVLSIFEEYPNWISSLLEASPLVGGLATSLAQETLNSSLTALKKDPNISKLQIKEKWRLLWMDSLCEGFLHENEEVRRVSLNEMLKCILKIDKTSYLPLLEAIQSYSSLKMKGGNNNKSVLLRSLVAILKSGRRSGAVTSDMLEEWLTVSQSKQRSMKGALSFSFVLFIAD